MRKKMMGGGMMQRPMYNKGGDIKKPESKKPESKKPKSKNKVRVLPSPRRVTNLLPLKPKPRDPKRKPNTKIFDIIGDILKTPYKIRGGSAKGGRIKKMGGGSLKSVPAGNKGLKKLPTEVRNKMGFMKKGGSVAPAPKKDYKLGTKFQGDYKGKSVPGKVKEFFKTGAKQTIGTAKKIATNKKAMKVAKGVLNVAFPAVGAAEVGKKIARKFKGDK